MTVSPLRFSRLISRLSAFLLCALFLLPLCRAQAQTSDIWRGIDIASASDNKTRLLWRHPDGSIILQTLDASGAIESGQKYGPFAGYSAITIAVGADLKTRVLWRHTDGTIALWVVSAAGSVETNYNFGPYAGWTVTDMAVGSDNKTRVLWVNSDGRMTVWRLGLDGQTLEVNATYGPVAGWSAKTIGVGGDLKTRVMWRNTDGSMSIWTIAPDGSFVSTPAFGPYVGWTATDMAVGPDNKMRFLWLNSDGRISLWHLSLDGQTTEVEVSHGPFSGWTAAAIAVGGDGKTRVLWNHTDGSASLWRASLDGLTAETIATFGPYTSTTSPPVSPSAPDTPTFSNIAQTTLTATAPALPANATSLTLQKKLGSEAATAFADVATLVAGGAATNVTGLTAATAYSFRYVAVGAGGTSSTSADVTTLAAVPTGLTATAGNAQVSLSWTAVAGATGYKVKRSLTTGGPYVVIATVTTANHIDTGLTNGTTYYYVVTATNAGGESAPSNEASATPQPPIPAVPINLVATAGNAQVSLSWTASAGATSYKVKRSTTAGGPYTLVASPTATTFTNTGLTNGTTYYYVVTAINAGGESANSNEANATPQPPIPPAPINLTATPGNAKATLAWTASAGATSYNVKRATASSGPYASVGTTTTATTFLNTGLTNGTTYYYVVSATRTNIGTSSDSNIAGVTPQLPPPLSLTATPGNRQIVLGWGSVTGAIGYRVMRSATFGGPYAAVASPTATTFTDTGLDNDTTYYYVVAALSAQGASDPSNEASATPRTPPTTPLNLVASPGDGQILLSWSSSLRAVDYQVWRTVDGATWANITSVTGNTYTDVGLTNGQRYTYYVQARNAGGLSANSNTAGATPRLLPAYAPRPPVLSNITATSVTTTAPALPFNATSLTLQKRLAAGEDPDFANVATGIAGGAVRVVNGLSPQTSYYFRYLAVRTDWQTPGDFASATTLPPAPGAPDAPAFRDVAATTLTVLAPVFPPYATSFKLQSKLQGQPDTAYTDYQQYGVTQSFSSGSRTQINGLIAATAYTFRFVASGGGGSTPGAAASVSTLPPLPSQPGTPTFDTITSTSVRVLAPALPANATSLTLQRQVGSYSYSDSPPTYVDVATGLAGGAATPVTGLLPSDGSNGSYYGLINAGRYTFRYVAVGDGGSTTGYDATVTTLPPAPLAPEAPLFQNVTDATLTTLAPALPPYSSSLSLQKKLASDPDTSYATIATGIAGAGTTDVTTGLTAATTYLFRYLAVGVSGTTTGASANVTMAPAAPGAPGFSNIAATNVRVTAPLMLPTGASSLTLQRRLTSQYSEADYVLVASNIAAQDYRDVTGLGASTSYTFRFLAVGVGGSTPGTSAAVATASGVAGVPGAPTFSNITSTTVDVTAPAVPAGMYALSLQKKLATGPDSDYATYASYLYGGTRTTVSGLSPSTAYSFRYVAVTSGSETPGPGGDVTTLPAAPGAPGAPTFSSITSTSVAVTAPTLPSGATSLTLQRRVGNVYYSPFTYADVASGLGGGSVTTVSGLTPSQLVGGTQVNSTYYFRFVAVGPGGSTPGNDASVSTLPPAPGAPEAPRFRSVTDTTLTVIAPGVPINGTSLTLQRKLASDPLSVFVSINTGLNGGSQTPVSGLSAGVTYSFRFIAVGASGSAVGPGADVTTAPSAPAAPVLTNITMNGVRATAPALPAGASSLTLQKQSYSYYYGYGSGEPWLDVASGLAGGAVTDVTGLTPSSGQSGDTSGAYSFRYVAVGPGGSTPGASAGMTTLPPAPLAPGAPAFTRIQATSVDVIMPPLPPYAASLTLQRKLASEPDTAYQTMTPPGGSSSSYPYTISGGLSAQTTYSFRCLAVGSGGTTAGPAANVTTTPPPPEAPEAPSFEQITQTTIQVRMPYNLPLRATSLTLQMKLASEPDSAYADVAINAPAGSYIPINGLTAATFYTFRCVAVGLGGSTPGGAAGTSTLGAAPGVPGPPRFGPMTSDSVHVFAPDLPPGAGTMRLQGRIASQTTDPYVDLATGLGANADTEVAALDSGQTYSFRYVAVGAGPSAGLETVGPGDEITIPVPVVTWSAGDAIACGGIRWPQAGATLAQGAEGRLNSYLATDWDARDVSLNGAITGGTYSDACSYTWAASGGSFKNGINTGQSVVWIAPAVAGTYTVTLTVDDQASANKGNGEGGTRSDPQRGFNDQPLTFTRTITVP